MSLKPKPTKLEDLRFTITQDMENDFIEMIMIRQILKENKNLTKKERKLLEKELKELTALFVLDFRKNNVEQRKQYNDILNS